MVEDKLYNIAYAHLMHRIRAGLYPTGSRLPTVPMLCMEFHVSTFTIHNAFKILAKEQLVSLSQGRSAIVTYQGSPEECKAHFLALTYAMKEAVLDLQATLMVIWPGILLKGLQLCEEQDLEALAKIIDELDIHESQFLHHFFGHIIEKIRNPLLSNFHMSTNLFMHSINCANHNAFVDYFHYLKKNSRELIALRRAEAYTELRAMLVKLCAEQGSNIEKFLQSLPPAASLDKPIPFRWNYYMGRPQVSFKIAMELLKTIYSSYKKYEFLPSVRQLSIQYHVPIMSIRRAVQILNDIGITESINGKGTRVIVGDGTPIEISYLSSPNLKRALIPYLQSMQFLLITCKDCIQAAFPKISEAALRHTADQLQEIHASGDYFKTFGICLDLFIAESHSASFHEIFGHLKHLQYLGYPLNDLKPNAFRYDDQSIKILRSSLEQRNTELFAAEMERLTLEILKAGREKMLAGGIQEEELVFIPPL